MKKIIMSVLAAASLSAPALADDSKIVRGYNTMDSMGCMLVRDCTDGVKEVNSIVDISGEYSNWVDFSFVTDEFDRMLSALNKVGVKVFLAPEKYFPAQHRGVYHTVGNNFFLNKEFMNSPTTLMSVMRHEGWHAAQDCMAGTIDNSMIAIIKPEYEVPMIYQVMVERTYPKHAWPWEKEASWAGRTEGMTMKALEACAAGPMWEVYEPTPLTRKYLVNEGFIK